MKIVNSLNQAIFGRRALHRISAEDYIGWAEGMLMEGYDGLHLRILAGLDRHSSVFDVELYFQKVLRELEIQEPEFKVAVRAYASELAKKIIDKRYISSRDAIRALYQLCRDMDYDSDYMIWLQLDDALDSLNSGTFPHNYPSATLENFDEIVQREARKFI